VSSNGQDNLPAWELFREELRRNINPNEQQIKKDFGFLVEKGYCPNSDLEKLVHVRLMASYEAGLNEYLHPPLELKQGNIKAEIIHIGTLVEALLRMVVDKMLRDKKLNEKDIKAFATRYPKETTFKQIIDISYLMNNFDSDFYKILNALRDERNKVHIGAIMKTTSEELDFEEYRAIEFRRKLDHLLWVMKTGEITRRAK
jgi:hypothetical protein